MPAGLILACEDPKSVFLQQWQTEDPNQRLYGVAVVICDVTPCSVGKRVSLFSAFSAVTLSRYVLNCCDVAAYWVPGRS